MAPVPLRSIPFSSFSVAGRNRAVHGATEQAVIGFSPLRQVTERRRKKRRTGRRWSKEEERGGLAEQAERLPEEEEEGRGDRPREERTAAGDRLMVIHVPLLIRQR